MRPQKNTQRSMPNDKTIMSGSSLEPVPARHACVSFPPSTAKLKWQTSTTIIPVHLSNRHHTVPRRVLPKNIRLRAKEKSNYLSLSLYPAKQEAGTESCWMGSKFLIYASWSWHMLYIQPHAVCFARQKFVLDCFSSPAIARFCRINNRYQGFMFTTRHGSQHLMTFLCRCGKSV